MMSLSEMKNYLDSSLEYYSSSLKMLVLTGGEPFLLGGSLDDIIEYATKKGLKTRVVTNAFWATSFEKSYDRLTKLWNRGLTEINFSTGDEH